MLRLNDYVLSAECYTVRLMLALLALPHERVAVDVYPGGAEAPVLEYGDTVLRDPGLILAFLARSYGADWMPDEAAPEISRWLAFAATDLAAINDARRVAVLGQPGDLAELNGRGRFALRRIEEHLTRQRIDGLDWMAGVTPTIADIAIFPAVMLSHDSGLGHEEFPAINLWQRRVRRLPGFVGMPGIPDYF